MEARNPRLIALVASRYRELQGLQLMVDAMFPLYMGVLMTLARRWDEVDPSPWALAAAAAPLLLVVVAQIPAKGRIRAYYRSRFGRVAGPHPFSGARLGYQGLICAALIADAHRPWLTIAVVLATIGAWPAWVVWRDWPYRWHWLPAVLVAILTAADASRVLSYHAALLNQGGWALSVGAALAAGGLGDHLLLVRTLHGPAAGGVAASEDAG